MQTQLLEVSAHLYIPCNISRDFLGCSNRVVATRSDRELFASAGWWLNLAFLPDVRFEVPPHLPYLVLRLGFGFFFLVQSMCDCMCLQFQIAGLGSRVWGFGLKVYGLGTGVLA